MIGHAHGNLSGKRLVIFGCGYVGSELVRQGIAKGLRVTALTRNAQKSGLLRQLGAEVVTADLAEASWHSAIPGRADWVVNCVSSGGGGLDGYRESYVKGTHSIVKWGRDCGPMDTMLYTSSTSVYPQGGGAHIDESAATEGVGERGKLLLEAEAATLGGAGLDGACQRAFVLRLAGIYGPSRHHLLDQIKAGQVSGRGDYHLNLIHRDDICAAIWAALESSSNLRGGIYNIADDGAALKSDIVAWIAARLSMPVPPFTGEPAVGRREITPDRVILNAKAKGALGWRPVFSTFREGYENLLSLRDCPTLSAPSQINP